MSLTDHEALMMAKRLALKAHPVCEIRLGRWLIGFEGQNRLFVVADRGVDTNYLAELIIEQIAIFRAAVAAGEVGVMLDQIRDLPPVGGVQ
jgi:hypothetical protein